MSQFSLKRGVLSTLATAVTLFFHKMDAVQYVVSTIKIETAPIMLSLIRLVDVSKLWAVEF